MRTLLLSVAFLWSLKSFTQSKLIFTYDSAGNQIQYKYCEDGNCQSNKSDSSEKEKEEPLEKEQLQDDVTLANSDLVNSELNLILYPNPTYGIVNIEWEANKNRSLSKIFLLNVTGGILKTANQQANTATLEFEQYPVGVYFVKFLFSDNTTITKKIIKK